MQEVRKFSAKNGEEITLRPAAPDDSSAIMSTVRSISPERSYVLMEQYGKDEKSAREYILGMDRQNNLLLVAIANNAVIGCLAALQADYGRRPRSAHILNVGLHLIEAYRGLGIGTGLLDYAIGWAREHGFKKLTACIFTKNKRSLHVFSKAGFKEECIRQKQIRIGHEYIDEVCMGMLVE